ncbi:CocE/NonD family hydrolase [Baekduia sp. Peel2402]|uniref:CocE/NonD family hydrolase n=1 Tax=Baekduia sp. Peel2402 TaxID=3458296 RepID=UPI00403E632E
MVRARTFFAAVVLMLLALPTAAQALYVLGPDGTTSAVHSYAGAIRERVYIPQPGIDQDANGVADDIAIEIIRPDTGDSVPVVIDPSPYYTTVCRGNEGQCIADANSDGKNDKWPLFLDNYFVPRGYAVILAESNGTANSTGCPLHGGPGDIAGMKSVIDWLQGRVTGRTAPAGGGTTVAATWDNGKAAMIGKSYDGTLTEGVAATGVSGLTTIVPESAIDDWYAYSRMGGIRFNTHYPSSLSNTITDTAERAGCAATRTQMNLDDGDATGDRNAFWDARDYRPGLSNVTASVLAVHGLQDDNVRMDHLASWWAGLAAQGVPRKLWLMRAGHVDPFDLRRAEWVDTLHRWFDHWLYGVDNHIMDAPRVDLQDADGSWHTESDWPAPGTQPVALHLRATDAAAAGDIGLVAGSGLGTVSWLDASGQSETTMMNNPGGSQVNRRVFLSAPLKQPLRISGTPQINLKASLDKTQSNLGALIVDYTPTGGTMSQITRTGDGITNKVPAERTCWGEDDDEVTGDFSACYLEVTQPSTTVSQWRVTKGVLDSSNRLSLTTPTAVTIGTPDDFPISLLPQDHVFAAGHRIAVVLVANYSGFSAINNTTGTTVTMDALTSTVTLPVVGGASSAAASGAFDATTPVLIVPADVAVDHAPSSAGATVSWPAATATDDSDPSPAVSCSPASGTVFAIGSTTVTCTATDASGNATTGTFTVTVGTVAELPNGDGGNGGGGGGGTTGGETITTPAPVTPPSGSGATVPTTPPSPTLDVIPVKLSKLTLTGRPGSVLAAFTLSADATVTITITRQGAKRATKTGKAKLKAGKRTLRVNAKALKAGRYTVVLTARGANGKTTTVRKTLTIRR